MSDFRLRLTTTMGNLVSNRKANKSFYFDSSGQPDTEFVEHAIKTECREKGVRSLSYIVKDYEVEVIVDWL